MFLGNDLVDRFGLGKGQETKASRTTGRSVAHDHTIRHGTVLLKVGTQTLVRRLPIQTADKHLSRDIISKDSTIYEEGRR